MELNREFNIQSSFFSPDVVLFSKQLELFDADREMARTHTAPSIRISTEMSAITHDSGKMMFLDRNVAIGLCLIANIFGGLSFCRTDI